MNIRTTCAFVFFIALGALAGGPLAGQQPGAFEMLAQVRKAYIDSASLLVRRLKVEFRPPGGLGS